MRLASSSAVRRAMRSASVSDGGGLSASVIGSFWLWMEGVRIIVTGNVVGTGQMMVRMKGAGHKIPFLLSNE